ncbi:M-phase inducer phosphatase 1-like [Haliotis rubra]|uniref:M-phase inducer phosphatase 1-like n=1 Tax=Haliotis rubra TaxID=36100 RepID=UPI001EE605DE|nr:M-phase inducer phosphatase 1-like [Haliotis rubra]
MPRRQLMFCMESSDFEDLTTAGDVSLRSPDAFTPKSPLTDEEDSNDSGFESLSSDNEVSPLALDHRTWNGCHGARRSLFSGKRSRAEEHEEQAVSLMKKLRSPKFTDKAQVEVISKDMKTAVEKMQNEDDLIGDGSQNHSLQTIKGRHKDLKSVSPHTVSQLLAGEYDDVIPKYRIIDCRYPYEYEGGHIEGAENLHNEALISNLVTSLQVVDSTQRNILVFHCEFSSERGPKLLRHLRNLDRKLNSDRYPFLLYPEVYLLDGGYKAFYEQHQCQCEPRSYLPMLHQDYSKQLRHFRVKSKSRTAGQKQSMRSQRFQMDASPLKLLLQQTQSRYPLSLHRRRKQDYGAGKPQVSPQSLAQKQTNFYGTKEVTFHGKRPRDNDNEEDEYVLARQIKKQKTVDIVNKTPTEEVTSDVMRVCCGQNGKRRRSDRRWFAGS